jgi:hypothetical protein
MRTHNSRTRGSGVRRPRSCNSRRAVLLVRLRTVFFDLVVVTMPARTDQPHGGRHECPFPTPRTVRAAAIRSLPWRPSVPGAFPLREAGPVGILIAAIAATSIADAREPRPDRQSTRRHAFEGAWSIEVEIEVVSGTVTDDSTSGGRVSAARTIRVDGTLGGQRAKAPGHLSRASGEGMRRATSTSDSGSSRRRAGRRG